MTSTSSSDGAVRVTLHPGEDLLLRPGTRLGDVRAPLAALVRRPELRWAPLTVDGVRLTDDQVVGERPLLPGAVLRVRWPDGAGADGAGPVAEGVGHSAGGLVAGPGARPGSGPGSGLGAGGPGGAWLVVRVTGLDAGTIVGVDGPWAALRAWVRLCRGGRLAIRRSRGPADLLVPRPEAAPGGVSWPLVLLPAVASLVLAAVLRQPVLAVFALVGLVVAAPQLRAARRRTAGRGAAGGGSRELPGPARLLAFAHAALHVSPGAWAAARAAWAAPRVRGGATTPGAAPGGVSGAAMDLPSAPDDGWAALLRDGAVAVLGPADLARSVARALVAGLAARGAAVRVDDGAPGWAWVRWLPGGEASVLVVDGAVADGGVPGGGIGGGVVRRDVVSGGTVGRPAPSSAHLVVSVGAVPPGCRAVVQVLDPRRVRITGPDGAARTVPLVGVTVEWADHLARLLAGAAWLGRTAATLRGSIGGSETGPALVAGAGSALAGTADARWSLATTCADDPRLPAAVSLTRAHGLDEIPGPDHVAARWARADSRASAEGQPAAADWPAAADRVSAASRASTASRASAAGRAPADDWSVPLGLGADGAPVLLDLVRDGPHLLVAGTTGSGKSELLLTLVLGLALARSPADLALVLVDFKGGASLGACDGLPHVVGQVTDLEPGLAARALAGLRAELRRRERVLAERGAADVIALPPGVLPRLVVVIDEFRALADDLPAFLPALLRVAAQGRSLGVHLVLATQRPGGAVGPDLRANVSARLALRVTDPLESRDVVDDPAAAYLPSATPGRAVLRLGSAPPVLLQCAHATRPPEPRMPLVRRAPARLRGRAAAQRIAALDAAESDATAPHPAAPHAVGPHAVGPHAPGHDAARQGAASQDTPGQDTATLVVDAVRRAADMLGHRPGAPPWLPPLPRSAGAADLPPRTRRDGGGLALALGDDPEGQRRTTVTWRPKDGHLAVLGRARSGRTTALVTVALAALRQGWRVHGITHDAAGLGALRDRPGYTGTSHPDDAEALDRLLSGEPVTGVDASRTGTESRTGPGSRTSPAPAAPAAPRTLVLIDGVEDVRATLPVAALRSGAAFAVTADGPSVGGLAARFGPHLVLLSTDRAADVVLGAPAMLAGAGGPPGRAAWCGRGDPVLCQVLEPEVTPPDRPPGLSPPSGSRTSPRRRRAS
ncbi:FtsK/SpoIIIE domain-containing protein [Promicromonospora sp. NPDC060204]|uniref:FtsK/SpoIIIE domain-containing protein n=1 Tax=Promicromonospora sp. NPDC060204 TaxID=3347071 RepID=UPI003656D7A1